MNRSIGALEFRSISKGIEISDKIVKRANVEIIYCQIICPGKYLIIITGDEAAVDTAIDTGIEEAKTILVDSFKLHAVSPFIIAGFKNKYETKEVIEAVGVVETNKVCTGIVALDHVLKSGDVKLIKMRLAQCISGKLVFIVTGVVSSIEYGFLDLKNILSAKECENISIIPSPSEEIRKYLA